MHLNISTSGKSWGNSDQFDVHSMEGIGKSFENKKFLKIDQEFDENHFSFSHWAMNMDIMVFFHIIRVFGTFYPYLTNVFSDGMRLMRVTEYVVIHNLIRPT